MSYPELKDCYLGFIGAGNIANALISGFLKSGQIKANQLSVSAPTDRNLVKFKELGCFTTNSNNKIFENIPSTNTSKQTTNWSKVLVLCVKPNIFKNNFDINLNKLNEIYGNIIVVSVMAGITIEQLKKHFHNLESGIKYVRLMPNTAATVGAGICVLSLVENNPELKEFLTKVFTSIGLCEFVGENQINAVCGVGGSGIAFVYTLIHAMSDGGLKMGLPRNVSTNIAAQTVLGAALMVLNTGKNPIVLRDEVTSPGGTTIHGLHALEKAAFNSAVIDAIESATERANQLS